MASNKCGSDPVFDGEAGNENVFAVATKRGCYFFSYEEGELKKKKGIFNGNPMTSMITITFSPENNCFFTGTAKGAIYRWDGSTCTKAHMGVH